MTTLPIGTVLILTFAATVVLSGPLATIALVVSASRPSVADGLVRVGAGVAALALLGALAVALAVTPVAGLVVATSALGALLVLGVVPLVVGRELLARRGFSPDGALQWALIGWPFALWLALAIFLAPGGPSRYNLTFLSGVAAVIGWTALVAVLLLGPAVAGLALWRLTRRF